MSESRIRALLDWENALGREPRPVPADIGDGDTGSIFWPWIGKQYRPGGVCFITLNINASGDDRSSVVVEYQIASEVIDSFSAGDRAPFGRSEFFWRLLCTASAVLAWIRVVRRTSGTRGKPAPGAALPAVNYGKGMCLGRR